jgi:hypothetical protein
MNKQNFLRKFACIDGILRLKELETFQTNTDIFSNNFNSAIADECSSQDQAYDQYETSLINHYNCQLSAPLCLYDFTLKQTIIDQHILSIPDLRVYIVKNYFKREDGTESDQAK